MATEQPKRSKSRLPMWVYGIAWPQSTHPAEIELACFRDGHNPPHGLGRYEHFLRAAKGFLPSIEWNPWLELQIQSLTDDRYAIQHGPVSVRFVSWTGCGSAGKTHSAGFYAYLWWLAAPEKSSVTLTSTSKTAIGQRVWPVIQKLHGDIIDPWTGDQLEAGHIIDSSKMLQAAKGDSKYAIHAIAVEKGELQKAINGIKGRHTERMMLIVDEANTTPTAVFECIPNMSKGCRELVVLVIGNAISRFDTHGRCCEPEAGWNSIGVMDTQWKTKGVPEWGIDPGVCIHFDGERSPNVIRKNTLWPYLYSYEDHKRRRHDPKSIQYWSQDRGFWPLEGLVNTVLSEVMIDKYDGRGEFLFSTYSQPVAGLDPGFGGDKCIARFGVIGDIGAGKLGVMLTDIVEIEAQVDDPNELDYQIARRFIAECKARQVEPRYAGVDSTGIGRGVYAVIATEWSTQVNRVEFGGSASELPASLDDPRPAKQVYDRKVTEIVFSVRELLVAGQLRGLKHDEITQFCTREYSMRGKLVRLDTKEEVKKKLGRSPDEADSVGILVHVARLNGVMIASGIQVSRSADWRKLSRDVGAALNETYGEENEFELVNDDAFEPLVLTQ